MTISTQKNIRTTPFGKLTSFPFPYPKILISNREPYEPRRKGPLDFSSSDDEHTPRKPSPHRRPAAEQKELKLVNFSKITPDPNTYIEGTQIKVQSVAHATFCDGSVRTYVKPEGGFPLVPLGSATLVTRKEETECK